MGEIIKQEAQKLLSNVNQEYVFWRHDGQTITNLKELQVSLAAMSNNTYRYHSNEEKQDFSNWVRDIIGDQVLANDLQNAKSRPKALNIVKARVILLKGLL